MKRAVTLLGFILLMKVGLMAENYRFADPDKELKDIVSYDSPQAQFADYYSRLGVYAVKRHKKMEIGSGKFVCQRNGKVFMSDFCSIGLKDLASGEVFFTKKDEFKTKKMDYYPWGYVSSVENEDFRLSLEVVFHSIDLIMTRVKVVNLKPEAKKVSLVVEGNTIKDKEEKTISYDKANNIVQMSVYSKPPTPYPLKPEPDFTIYTAIKFGFPVNMNKTEVPVSKKGIKSACYEGESAPVEIKGNSTWESIILISAAQDTPELPVKRVSQKVGSAEETIQKARTKWIKLLESFPNNVEEKYRRTLYKAAVILTKNTIVGQKEQNFGSSFGPYRGTFPSRFYYEALWVWDSAFQAMAFKEWDTELAKDNIRIMFHNQDESGYLMFLFPDSMVLQAQPPFFAWVAVQIYEKDKDINFLKEMYPKFCKWAEWRFQNRDKNENGLYEWGDRLESGWDTSPRWDKGVPKLEAPDLNGFLYMDMKMLAKIAKILGKKDEETKWKNRADELGKKVIETLYDPEDKIFYDWNYKKESFSKILTPACFLPLWGGVPIEKEKAREMISKYLLSEKDFYGKVPFPSVAYSEKTHESQNYWRGPTWLNMAYFMIDVLYLYGFDKEAQEARTRMLDIISRDDHIFEYYDTKTGKGYGAMDFSWSCAFTVEMILNHFKMGAE